MRILAALGLGAAFTLLAGGCGSGSSSPGPSDAGATGGATGSGGDGATGGRAGSGGKSSGSGGAAAGGAAAGGSSGAGGGAAGAVASERAACIEYVEAACARLEQCNATDPERCLALRAQCPDYMFSPGGTRTKESLSACAKAWAALPCGVVNNGGSPPCAARGTRAPGEPCLYQHQCASAVCTVNGGAACGTCGPASENGGPCARLTTGCVEGLHCVGGVCAEAPPTEEPKLLAPMAACMNSSGMSLGTCPRGYGCARTTGGSSYQCHPLPGPGSVCVGGRCAEGAYCSVGTADDCLALPPAGKPCVDNRPIGEPTCALDAYCDGESSACVARSAAGGGCTSSDACRVGLRCAVQGTARNGICVSTSEEGEPCDGATKRCADGTSCDAGVCRSTGPLGLYDAACSP